MRIAGLMLLTFVAGLGTPAAFAAQLNSITSLTDSASAEPSETDLISPQFVAGDVPLMPGLHLIANNDVVFFSAEAGRIAETDAVGSVDIDDVYNFYSRSLPHLGWQRADARHYSRDRDRLSIDAHADGATTMVHFAITPSAR